MLPMLKENLRAYLVSHNLFHQTVLKMNNIIFLAKYMYQHIILENQSIVQAVLLGLLGAACVTLILLSVFVIRKRNQEKSLE